MSCYNCCTNVGSCMAQKCNCEDILKQEKQKQLMAFSDRMEKQLRTLTNSKNQQVEELNNQNQSMKMQILKLQHRNKLDQQNQNRLKDKVRQLQEIIEQYKRKFNEIKPSQTKEVIKEVYREKQVPYPALEQECESAKRQNRNLRQKIAAKEEAYLVLSEEYERQRIKNKNDKDSYFAEVKSLNQLLINKNKQAQNLNTQISYLQERVQILNKPSGRSYSPLVISKKQVSSPQIKTIYIEKPVEKTVFVEVQKKITQFVQPERPVVNRVINCPEKTKCKCDDISLPSQKQKYEEQDYESVYNKYQNVISSYKNQRQKLVQHIKNRDSDINLLSKQVDILSFKSGKPRCQKGSDVRVTVTRDDDMVNRVQTEQKNNMKPTKIGSTKGLHNRKKN